MIMSPFGSLTKKILVVATPKQLRNDPIYAREAIKKKSRQNLLVQNLVKR